MGESIKTLNIINALRRQLKTLYTTQHPGHLFAVSKFRPGNVWNLVLINLNKSDSCNNFDWKPQLLVGRRRKGLQFRSVHND